MYKIIGILLFVCLIAAEALDFPITLNTDTNVLFDDVKTKNSYQLPNTAEPKKYTIELTPYFDDNSEKAFKFDGIVTIDLEVNNPVNNITFHSRNLTILKTELTKENNLEGVYLKPSTQEDDEKDFKIILKNSGNFDKGKYSLRIQYVGILADDMRGFYRSSYTNDKKQKIWLATTHFEPVGARRAFPCFDEPKYKATFDVIIHHPVKYTAISNTKVVKSEESTNGRKKTSFETTPLMSTYLLAFVVSDFKSLPEIPASFNVYARPNAIKNGDLALETGKKLLQELEKFTGIKFELEKMDQVAIPDFAAGAMENWGLVLYREKSLLFDEKVLTTSEKQNIVETIAHEFAHQWFGDLVSPKWWKYLWLNEGFATFFQSLITEKVEPSWRSIDQSVVKSIQTTAFDFDSGSTTHQINQDVESPKEISAIFDSISYQKGGAVIRMMQHFLTEQIFQKGLNSYLTTNKYKATDSDDLFKALQDAAKKDQLKVKEIMDTWVNHKGYPIVTVTRNYDKDGKVEIKQERFFTYNTSEEEKKDNHKWHIPLNFATENKADFTNTTAEEWLKDTSVNISVDVEPNNWLIVNKQQTGFYRVNYDEKNWKLIIDYLRTDNRKKIHVLNRAQLVNDALAFVKQGKLSLSTLLHLTAYLKNETDYVAWYPGFKTFSWLNTKLINTEHYKIYKEHVLNTTQSLVKSVGLEETSKDEHLTKLNRIAAINLACLLGDESCTTKMNSKLVEWLKDTNKNTFSPDLKQATLCHGLRTATMDIWNQTLLECVKSTDPDKKNSLITALGCSTNTEMLQYYLNYAAVDNSTLDDITAVIKSIYDNSDVGIDVVLDFVTERFVTLYRKIKDDKRVTSLITSIGEKLTTQDQLNKLIATEKKDVSRIFTAKAIEAAEKNIHWLKENEEALVSWTKEIVGSGVKIVSASMSLIFALLVIVFITMG